MLLTFYYNVLIQGYSRCEHYQHLKKIYYFFYVEKVNQKDMKLCSF